MEQKIESDKQLLEQSISVKIIRIFGAFIIGIIIYCIGFFLGAFGGEILSLISIVLPPAVVRGEIWAGAAALAANIGSFALFSVIYPKVKSRKIAGFIFASLLSAFAIVYGVLCIISGEVYLLAYSGCCIIPLIVIFTMVVKEDF